MALLTLALVVPVALAALVYNLMKLAYYLIVCLIAGVVFLFRLFFVTEDENHTATYVP